MVVGVSLRGGTITMGLGMGGGGHKLHQNGS